MVEKNRVRRVIDLLRLWFGFRQRVGRRVYALTGFGLALFKYLVELSVEAWLTGRFWSPFEHLSPFWAARQEFGMAGIEPWILALWSIPFVWIGASMTARRAADAGLSPALAILFFVPGVNWVLLLSLCVARPRVWNAPEDERGNPRVVLSAEAAWAVALPALVITGLLFMTLRNGTGGQYAYSLFLGWPFALGFVSAFLFEGHRRHSFGASAGVVQASLAVCAGCLLLAGLEGAVCLLMAYPLAALMALAGGGLGWAAAERGKRRSRLALVLVLVPGLNIVDRQLPEPPLREVVTSIEIDAAAETIWPYLVSFTEMPPPADWVFKMGVAYPIRARIAGQGVGAVRYCEFSTGPFVEPITRWQEPVRLSFDVIAEPPTMEEWSPYKEISPPHLEGSFHSRRGEFRLIELVDGRTRLEGSTWYQIDMYPNAYWSLWSDVLIHSIHKRVLAHVKALSEAGPAADSAT